MIVTIVEPEKIKSEFGIRMKAADLGAKQLMMPPYLSKETEVSLLKINKAGDYAFYLCIGSNFIVSLLFNVLLQHIWESLRGIQY
jgi:hypothetical protein